MDIMSAILWNLGLYDNKINAMRQVRNMVEGENRKLFEQVIKRYLDENINTFVPDAPEEDDVVLATFPDVKEVVRIVKATNPGDTELAAGLIVYTMALANTNWGMTPWNTLVKAVRQFQTEHLESVAPL